MIANVPQYQIAGRHVLAGALLAALIAVPLGQSTADAQATIRGRVLDSETGHPLAGATVAIRRGPPPLTTDSLGRFEAANLAGGQAQLTIRILGYAAGDFRFAVPDSGVVDRVFPLDFTGDRLPEVVVQARAEQLMPRYMDFEQRRRRGLGAYFRWDEIKNKSYGSVGDVLRTVRGVRIQCNQQTWECHAVMVRTPQCPPTWFIDGVEVRSFHENTPIRDVYGIEIYRGPGEVPGEYSGSNAACGVIVMWTKSKPFR
ncbi:MAG TPA: carboxypeptidase regulatory-like domain-containing protein [Gemmatimonadaceae bacterium]|nr:carboxypeptidase regulatory-like domain-containing protein [Gemmatimonadaceae bacterium]